MEVGVGPTSIEDTTVPQMRSLRQDVFLTQAEKEVGVGPTSIEDTTVPQMRSLRQDVFLTQAEKTE